MNNEKKSQPVEEELSLLADEPEEGVQYIKPNIEVKLPPNKRMECREIVQEVKNFGINQRQILYLIYLLALELEDITIMKALTTIVGENRDKIEISNLILK